MSVTTHLKAYVAVGCLLLGGLLAGCASGEQTAARLDAASIPTHPGLSTQLRNRAVHVVPLQANRIAAARIAPKGTTSSVWSRMTAPRDLGAARVYLSVDVPVCSGKDGAFTVTTTSKRVEIGYWVRPDLKDGVCAAMRVTTNGYIQLPAAIGRREVVHVPPGRRA